MAGIPQTRSPDAVPGPLPQTHLADTTVWSKVRPRPLLADWFNEEVRSGRIATCDIVVLELLRSARNSQAFVSQSRLLALLPGYPIAAAEWARGHEVQQLLAAQGQHRGIPPTDLLIAAAAESAQVPLLHYDHDFDLIAGVTGQPVRWLLPAGTLP